MKLISYLHDGATRYGVLTASGVADMRDCMDAAPATINDIDGLRVDWPDGFGLIRASNTTPVLVLRFEGHTEAALQRISTDMLALLRTVKPDAQWGAGAH